MITFVDTNVLLDVFLPDPVHGVNSSAALEKAFHEGSLVVNEIVYAELAPQFESRKLLDDVLWKLGIQMVVADTEIAFSAGEAWKTYRKTAGKRDRIIADFLIGAHALLKADRLLTRDRGFYKDYFKKLVILNPQYQPEG
jgi:predicted nucleic acid-binding protein